MRTVITLVLPLAGVGALAGCSSDSDTSADGGVVATTGILADITRQVAGPAVQVEQLIPDGASPHDFQLSAQDRQELEQAALVVDNGASLEAGIPLDELGAPRWTLAEHTPDLLAFEEGGSDPHIWMDPSRVAAALPSLASALADVDPARAEEFDRRATAYAAELRDLGRALRRELESVSPPDRVLVTSHDSLGYFADAFGYEVAATVFPASGPEAEASAAQLDELSQTIVAHDVRAVFAGDEDDPQALRTVADAAGIAVVDDLQIESPGAAGTYERMLRHDSAAIADALSR